MLKSVCSAMVLVAFAASSGCNTFLGTDDIRTDGCPSLGALDCSDARTPQVCAANGKWESQPPCYQQACVAGTCAGECSPATWRCAEKTPQFCDDTGHWQDDAIVCEHLCYEGTCVGSCTPGEKRCNGDTPETCGGIGEWVSSESPCTDQWCDPDTGSCAGVCSPGQTMCSALNEFMRCGVDTSVTPQEVGKFLIDMPCEHQTCKKDFGCAGVCAPGESHCNGNIVEQCLGGFNQPAFPCAGQTCRQGECIGECEQGMLRCSGATVQVCDGVGQWQNSALCSGSQHCEGGACVDDCTTGDVRCRGNTSYVCVNGAWQVQETCADQTCIPNLGICMGECAPGQARCMGQIPETCDVDGHWKALPACPGACVDGSCPGPSCNGLPENCGPNHNENCCASRVVPPVSFLSFGDSSQPSTVSEFRLDRFEVTVGRLKGFYLAYQAGMATPPENAGAHPKWPSSGWQSGWNSYVQSDMLPNCPDDSFQLGDSRPANCMNWYTAFAFCIWDGGRLPTDAEWFAAAAAGAELRRYPWSAPPQSTLVNPSYAVYGCTGDGSPEQTCNFELDLLSVGSRSPKGDGKYGHADLGGSVSEWVLDAFGGDTMGPCNDCLNWNSSLDPTVENAVLGGDYERKVEWMTPSSAVIARRYIATTFAGIRCARLP